MIRNKRIHKVKYFFSHRKIHINNRGETMIELVTSLALFAMTMVLVAVLFSNANRILVKNNIIQKNLNHQVNDLELGNNLKTIQTDIDMKFKLTKEGSLTEQTEVRAKVKLVKPMSGDSEGTTDSVLAKFERITESESGDGS